MTNELEPDANVIPLVPRDDISHALPDTVFVLCRPGDTAPGPPEVWRTERGDVVAAVYSSLTLLVAACGEGAPWVEITRDVMAAACDRLGITLLAQDAALPGLPHYPEPDVRTQPDLEELDDDPVDVEFLYLPSRPVGKGSRQVQLELQRYQGKLALLAYTSTEQLEEGCGPHQPWVAIQADRLNLVMDQCGAEGVLFNPELGDEARHSGPVHDWTRSKPTGGN